MTEQVFPIVLDAIDMGNWVDSPKLAESIWRRIRPAGIGWYAVDCTITSRTQVELYVYAIRDTFRGGIGRRINHQVVTELTDEERQLIEAHVASRCTELAEIELEARELAERQVRILALRKEMFGV